MSTKQGSPNSIHGYRTEIDGLRAIAIILVLVYHAKLVLFGETLLTGGYVGVDVFFVISGYLITGLILDELNRAGSFDLANFYDRRVRRILPVLITMSLVGFILAWNVLLPRALIDYSNSVLAAIFSVSNLYFHFSTTEYGAEAALFTPLLHTWSLGVEEQFYLLFPPLLSLLFRRTRKYLVLCVFICLLGSLFLTIASEPQTGFYLLSHRAWELLVGAAIAFKERDGFLVSSNLGSQVLSSLGLIAILWSGFYFDQSTTHPGVATLVPVLGTALVLMYVRSSSWLTGALSIRPLVTVGLLSYSLYVWHYLVFTIYRHHDNTLVLGIPQSSPWDKVEWLAITFALSVLSYRLIEQPCRKKNIVSGRTFYSILTSTIVVLICATLLIKSNAGFPTRFPPLFNQLDAIQSPWLKLQDKQGNGCHFKADGCLFDNQQANGVKIAFVGDSHLSVLSADLHKRLRDRHSLYFGLGCPLLKDSILKHSLKGEICGLDFHQRRWQQLMSFSPDVVVVLARTSVHLNGSYFDTKEGHIEGLAKISIIDSQGNNRPHESIATPIEILLNQGRKVIFVSPIPEPGWNVPRKLASSGAYRNWFKDEKDDSWFLTTSYKVYKERTKGVTRLINNIDHPNFHIVDASHLFCNTLLPERCLTHDQQNFYYVDDNHPSAIMAEKINDLISRKISLIK